MKGGSGTRTASDHKPPRIDIALENGLPQNIDVERLILGAVIQNNALLPGIIAGLEVDDFSLQRHRRIFARMIDLHQRSERIDRAVLANALQEHGQLESDGLTYLAKLDEDLPSIPNIESYVTIVRQKAEVRRLIFRSQEVIEKGVLNDGTTADEILSTVFGSKNGSFTETLADVKPSAFDRLAPYPAPLGPAAYYGLAGDFVRLVEPHTEGDPNVLLVSFLIHAGNVLGRESWIWTGSDKQHTNLFACLVGSSYFGRKGSASSTVKMFFNALDPVWAQNNITSGMSTGEGLIWVVRDPIWQRRGKSGDMEELDAGISDKRLLIVQSEFFGALQAMKRQGNTLSSTIRDAWDREKLSTLTKNSPARATNPHISILASITREELLRGSFNDELDNGFANRFIWICSTKAQDLPEGGRMNTVDFSPLCARFMEAREKVQKAIAKNGGNGAVYRDGDANDMWGYDDAPGGLYRHLNRNRSGIFAHVTARAAPQVLRLALIYTLLDGSLEMRKEHLLAGSEVWRYAEDGAAYTFGDALGDPTADAILADLQKAGAAGRTRKHFVDLFGRHKRKDELDRALMVLHGSGRARFERNTSTGGRPAEVWFVISAK